MTGACQGFLFPSGKISLGGKHRWINIVIQVLHFLLFGSVLISNIFLTIIKLIVGFIFQSPVLMADGFNNAGDVIASGAALTSMRISKRPADDDHPYGHGKAEVIGSAIVALILGIAALYIAYESVSALLKNLQKPA